MKVLYVSGDIEATGPAPGVDMYSMIAFGMMVIEDQRLTFYREIKPLNKNFVPEAMRVACRGLECLKPLMHVPQYDPAHASFNPRMVLDLMEEQCMDPGAAMQQAKEWVDQLQLRFPGRKFRYAARPVVFDGAFMNYYFHKFVGENPFGHSGEDINSLYRGSVGDELASINRIRQESLTHHGLDDAIQQGMDQIEVSKEMEKNKLVRKIFSK